MKTSIKTRFALLFATLFLAVVPCRLRAEGDGALSKLQERLLTGVSTIGMQAGCIPGNVLVLDRQSVLPLAYCKNGDNTRGFVAAAGLPGKGRFLYFGHPAFLQLPFFADTKALYANALPWLTDGAEAPKIALLRCKEAEPLLREILGEKATITHLAKISDLASADLLVSKGFEMEEVPVVRSYVEGGGGLLMASLGWGFLYYHSQVGFTEGFPDNHLLGSFGALMTDTYMLRFDDGVFPVYRNDAQPGVFVEDAIELAKASKNSYETVEIGKQVFHTLSDLVNALPSGIHPETEKHISSMFAANPDVMVPSPATPVGIGDLFSRMAILSHRNSWLSNREKVWPAHPAAKSYPGLVKDGTPSIEREIEVSLSVPKWHSTGLFAPAGQALTVIADEKAIAAGLAVRIGTSNDNITSATKWKRAPVVSVEVPIRSTKMEFSSPFGGLVYVVVPEGAKDLKGTLTVKFSGAVMAPWFKLGRDTNEKFIRECAETGAPYGEIEGNNFVIAAETLGLCKVTDPAWIAAHWDRVLDACQDLAQIKEKRAYPERMCSDVQLTGGWLHGGYPLMSYVNEEHFDWCINKSMLEKEGSWGVFHEIGHNHQSRDWTPDGTGEVTVNLFTTYVLETVTGIDYRTSPKYPSNRQLGTGRVKNWVSRGKSFDKWKGDYFLALEMYLRLKDAYGWDAFKRVFARYRQPGFKKPATTEERWQTFARVFSEETGANIAAALAEWTIPITKETLDACAKYPPADASITKDLQRRPYVSPKTEPVEGQYMGVSLTGETAGEITLYPTRESVPGGEQDRRWKTTHLLLRRIEPSNGPVKLGNLQSESDVRDGVRTVEITKPYYIGIYELTQEQWFHVMDSWMENNYGAEGDRETRPVGGISYHDARGSLEDGINWPLTGHQVSFGSFMGQLRELVSFRAEFDLPTEAQWEYAARGGTTTVWNNGETAKPYNEMAPDGVTKLQRDRVLDKLGRYYANGADSYRKDDPLLKRGVKTPYGTAEVGSYEPNPWGLYDCHGNLFEHVLDYFQPAKDCPEYSGKDPVGPEQSKPKAGRRVARGGSCWGSTYGKAGNCMIHIRRLGQLCATGTRHAEIGLRVCVPAAVATEPQVPFGSEPLTAEQTASRRQILANVKVLDSDGLPGPVYRTSQAAFPLVAARNWNYTPAVMAAASVYGKGRVIVVADDKIDERLGDNRVFLENARKWLADGASREVFEVDLAKLAESDIETLRKKVEDGAGMLAYGRAWPWRQKTVAETGSACLEDWAGNRLLAPLGLAIGDFSVMRTHPRGFSASRTISEGAFSVPFEFSQRIERLPSEEAVIRPRRKPGKNGIIVNPGETIAFLGDSITRLGSGATGYISLVIKGLEVAGVPDVKMVPAGRDGNHAGDMNGRIGGLLQNPDVRLMTISCGVNDVWGYDWGRGVQLEEYIQNVRSMYNSSAAVGVQVIALTPTLITEDPSFEKNRLLDSFADFIRSEAKARDLPLADPRADEIEALKQFPPHSGKHFTYDGVHPVFEGHKLIAKSVLRALGVSESVFPEIEKAWEEMKKKEQ